MHLAAVKVRRSAGAQPASLSCIWISPCGIHSVTNNTSKAQPTFANRSNPFILLHNQPPFSWTDTPLSYLCKKIESGSLFDGRKSDIVKTSACVKLTDPLCFVSVSPTQNFSFISFYGFLLIVSELVLLIWSLNLLSKTHFLRVRNAKMADARRADER